MDDADWSLSAAQHFYVSNNYNITHFTSPKNFSKKERIVEQNFRTFELAFDEHRSN